MARANPGSIPSTARTVSPRLGERTPTSIPSVSIARSWEAASQPCFSPSSYMASCFLLSCSTLSSTRGSGGAWGLPGASGAPNWMFTPSRVMPISLWCRASPTGARCLNSGSMYRCHRSGGSKIWRSESITLRPFFAISYLPCLGYSRHNPSPTAFDDCIQSPHCCQ